MAKNECLRSDRFVTGDHFIGFFRAGNVPCTAPARPVGEVICHAIHVRIAPMRGRRVCRRKAVEGPPICEEHMNHAVGLAPKVGAFGLERWMPIKRQCSGFRVGQPIWVGIKTCRPFEVIRRSCVMMQDPAGNLPGTCEVAQSWVLGAHVGKHVEGCGVAQGPDARMSRMHSPHVVSIGRAKRLISQGAPCGKIRRSLGVRGKSASCRQKGSRT